MELHLTRVTATDTDKEGNELKGKYGPFWRVGIQTKEYPDVWINGFTKKKPEWKVDDVVELDVRDEEYNGKMQKKFSFPKKNESPDVKGLKEDLFRIYAILGGMNNTLENIATIVGAKKKAGIDPYPTPEMEGIDTSKAFPDETDFSDEIPF